MAARKLEVVFVGDTTSFDRATRKIGGGADKTESKLAKLGKAMAGAFAVQKVAQGAKYAISAATDLNEQINKVSVVFRGSQKDLIKWSKTTASSLGISRREALETAGTFGNMLVPMGFARKKAEQMSKGLVSLSADMASFNNADPSQVLEALRAGLSGETEPLRKFGVFLSQAREQSELASMGIHKQWTEVTAAQKAQAIYNIILKDTTDAHGDFARTSNSLANQQRILKATAEDLAAGLGTALLPAAQGVATVAVKMLHAFQTLPGPIQNAIAIGGALAIALGALGAVAGVLGGGLATLAGAFTGFAGVLGVSSLALGGIVLAVAAVVVAGYLLIKHWDQVKAVASSVFGAVTSTISGAWNSVASFTTGVWSGIRNWLVGAWGTIRGTAASVFGAIRSVVVGAWNAISAATSAVWGAIRTALTAYWSSIRALVTLYVGAWRTVITGGWSAISTATSTVWNGIRTFLSGAWSGIRSTGAAVWDGIRHVIVTPIVAVGGSVRDVFRSLKEWLDKKWGDISGGVATFAADVAGKVGDAFKGAANAVIGFVNKIIDAINAIPGVPNIGHIKALAEGGSTGPTGKNVQALARGGKVNRPTVIMGEEAPRHPEWVIPTNPAYRGRAVGLLAKAASDLGIQAFAEGGVIGAFNRARQATHAGPKASLALFEAGAVESGFRNLKLGQGDRDSIGALQIRASTAGPMGINPNDPFASALAFLTRGFWGKGSAISLAGSHPEATAGWVAQQTQGSAYPDRYDQARGRALAAMGGKSSGGGGIGGLLGSVGGALGSLLSKGAGFILDKLPGIGSLPDWLAGTGKWVLSHVTDWIKDKVKGLVGGLVGGGGSVGAGVAGSIKGAIAFAKTLGFGQPSNGQLTGGKHAPNSWHYKGRAADFGHAGHSDGQMRQLFSAFLGRYGSHIKEMFYDPVGFYIKNGQKVPGAIGGHSDHLHLALAQGGIAPGGWVRVGELGAEWAQLPAGTRVHQASQSTSGPNDGPLIGELHVHGETDPRVLARELAWQVATAR